MLSGLHYQNTPEAFWNEKKSMSSSKRIDREFYTRLDIDEFFYNRMENNNNLCRISSVGSFYFHPAQQVFYNLTSVNISIQIYILCL